jgi:hypothetical protein
MKMLSNLLPGLREVRAPFVAGCITLVALYLLLDEHIADLAGLSATDNGIKNVSKLLLGAGGLAVAGIFAYLVGALIMQAMKQIKYRTAYLLDGWVSKKYSISEYASKPRDEWSLMARLIIPFSRTSLARLREKCEFDSDRTNVVQFEIRRSGGKRLLVANKDLYLEYDRLQAEADLRRAAAWPGLILLVALIDSVSSWWPLRDIIIGTIIGLIILLGLGIDARMINLQANSMYAHTVADGIVSTAALDERARELRDAAKSRQSDSSTSEAEPATTKSEA